MDRHTAYRLPADLDLAGADPDPNAQVQARGGANHRETGLNRSGRSVEPREDAIAGPLDDAPAESFNRFGDDAIVVGQQALPALVAKSLGERR